MVNATDEQQQKMGDQAVQTPKELPDVTSLSVQWKTVHSKYTATGEDGRCY